MPAAGPHMANTDGRSNGPTPSFNSHHGKPESMHAGGFDGSAIAHSPAPLLPAPLPLMRPRHGRWLAGVCRGIALHLGISAVWVRLAFIALTVMYGAGVIGYIFLWMFTPAGDPVAAAQAQEAAIPTSLAPLSKGNAPYGASSSAGDGNALPATPANADAPLTDGREHPSQSHASMAQPTAESLAETLRHAPKPALMALAGVALVALALLLLVTGIDAAVILSLVIGIGGVGLAWMFYNNARAQLPSMIGAIAIVFCAWMLYVRYDIAIGWNSSSQRIMASGLVMLIAVAAAVAPWINATVRQLSQERTMKEREEERADITAYLHDGVLQTLALIQLNADRSETVSTLARSQERKLREWLYQERSTSDRSVAAGLKQIAAEIEDDHGKPIDVVTVGDRMPGTQTDALLDAARQALINAVTHGGEPISAYCEASRSKVEIFVRDHGTGFDPERIPADRLGIRESIIGRIKRRGGTVEIVSRPDWGTEVRMHMPIPESTGANGNRTNGSHSDATRRTDQVTEPTKP